LLFYVKFVSHVYLLLVFSIQWVPAKTFGGPQTPKVWGTFGGIFFGRGGGVPADKNPSLGEVWGPQI
jgi:hypothetical protein